jgi:hypothetical protein
MAVRRFLFQALAAGTAYLDSSQDTDDARLNSIQVTMAPGTGTAIDLATNDIANVRKLSLVTGVAGVTIDGGGQRAANFGAPVNGGDLVNKTYADALAAGLDWKTTVRAASTANVTVAAPGAAIDGVTLAANDRVLLKNQTTGAENGIYAFQGAAVPMTRTTDGAAGQLTSGAAVFVSEGTAAADTGWTLTTNDPITVGTTAQTWTQFTSLGQVTAGAGLTKSGSTISVLKGDGIEVVSNSGAVNVSLTASGGLQLSGSSPNKTLGVLLPASSGLQLAAGGLSIDVVPSTGLALGASGISGVPNTAAGLGVDASGFKIVLNGTNPGLAFTSTYVDVKYDGARGITAGASGIGLALAATPGLTLTGNALAVVCDPNGGLQLVAGGVQHKLNGTTLSMGASGLSVLGVPAAGTWQIGGVATSANVTAPNLGTLTGGGDAGALHTHAMTSVAVPFTVGALAVTKGYALYISANDTVQPGDPAVDAKSSIIGVASATVAAAGSVQVQTDGLLTGAGSGWTGGQQIFMGALGAPITDPTTLASRARTIQLGTAKNATDLMVGVRDLGKKS